MNSTSWVRPSVFGCIAVVICISMSASLIPAQDLPPAGPGPLGLNAPNPPGLRANPVERKIPVEQILRLFALPAVQKALVLTDNQRQKIDAIGFNVRRATIEQNAALQILGLDFERLMQADTPDRAAIDKKIPEVSQALTVLMRSRINAWMDLHAILTVEQRDKIKGFLAQRAQQSARERMQPMLPGPKQNPPQQPGLPR